jgi:molybdopterin molybdotransferase
MTTVAEAQQLILSNCGPGPIERMALADALGQALAEDIVSDIDSPPYDKAMVDGYAIRSADVRQAGVVLQVVEEVTAGKVPTRKLEVGQATRIMTGAPLPSGADAVVMVEYTELESPDRIRVDRVPREVGDNIMSQATAMARGATVLEAGHRLRAMDLGVLSEVGRTDVAVYSRPTVAILATGDELVDADQVPGPGCIRNSNGPMLAAQVRAAAGRPLPLGIARDNEASLRERIAMGLEADILVLSGGVSAGTLDLVPRVLEDLEVRQIFHKVQLKPGKPIWFGRRIQQGCETLVFGLPGNPVSSMVCFELFVRTAMRRMQGVQPLPVFHQAELIGPFHHRGDRPTYHPAKLEFRGPLLTVEPTVWQGSSDLFGLAKANGLSYFPAGERHYAAGETVQVLWLEGVEN